MKPSVSGDGEYLVQMLILGLFFMVAFFSSATLVIEFRSWLAKIKSKITILAAIALGIFTASDLITDSCNVPWKYCGMAFSVFTMATCCGVIGIFLFDRTPVFSEKEEKAERPDILTVISVSFLALVPYALAFGVFHVLGNSQAAGFMWIFSWILIFSVLVIHGQIITWKGEKTQSYSSAEVNMKDLALNFFLRLLNWMFSFAGL